MGCSLRGMGDYWEEVMTRVGGLSRFTTKKKQSRGIMAPLFMARERVTVSVLLVKSKSRAGMACALRMPCP